MHEVITRSQPNGEPNPGSDDERPDAPPPHTHRLREANSQRRTRCSSGVWKERNSRHPQSTNESGFLNDSPRHLLPLPPSLLFLSLSSPLSLPPCYSPSHAKSFPRFPFLFGLLMWCLECRREGTGEGARGCVAETRVTRSCFIASQHPLDSEKSRTFMLDHHLHIHSYILQKNSIIRYKEKSQERKNKQ